MVLGPHCRIKTVQHVYWFYCVLGSIHFSDCSKTFQTLRIVFHIVRKLFRLFGNLLDCPETFQTVRKLSRLSRNFTDLCYVLTWFWAQFVYMRKNFSDAQKLSGWQCQRGNGLFLTLPSSSRISLPGLLAESQIGPVLPWAQPCDLLSCNNILPFFTVFDWS